MNTSLKLELDRTYSLMLKDKNVWKAACLGKDSFICYRQTIPPIDGSPAELSIILMYKMDQKFIINKKVSLLLPKLKASGLQGVLV